MHIYDVLGRAYRIWTDTGEINYTYDSLGRVTSKSDNEGYIKNYTYDIYSNVTDFELKEDNVSKTSISYTYDAITIVHIILSIQLT